MKRNELEPAAPEQPGKDMRKHALRFALLIGWGVVLTLQVAGTLRNPSVSNVVVAAAFFCLFAIVNVNLFLMGWLGHRSWRRVSNKSSAATFTPVPVGGHTLNQSSRSFRSVAEQLLRRTGPDPVRRARHARRRPRVRASRRGATRIPQR